MSVRLTLAEELRTEHMSNVLWNDWWSVRNSKLKYFARDLVEVSTTRFVFWGWSKRAMFEVTFFLNSLPRAFKLPKLAMPPYIIAMHVSDCSLGKNCVMASSTYYVDSDMMKIN